MERRREPRIPCNQPVEITVLGEPTMRLEAQALEKSGRGLRLSVPCLIPGGSPVKVRFGDVLLLGEVCYVTPGPEGYIAGLQIDQVLTGLQELARMNEAILGKRSGAPVPVSTR